jgi:DNA-binding GntR family transcriptional regulator
MVVTTTRGELVGSRQEDAMADASFKIQRNPAPVRAQVLEKLRDAICEMRFKPGQRLVERELVELCGVSRTSIREALRELAAERLVVTIPNKGVVVAHITSDEARELYEVRSSLEALATRLFVERADDVQVAALRESFAALERAAAAGESVLKAKDRFYAVLFAGARNDALRTVVEGLHARVSLLRSTSLSQPGRVTEMVAELGALVEAIEARDADKAARLCCQHVERAGDSSMKALADLAEGESKLLSA